MPIASNGYKMKAQVLEGQNWVKKPGADSRFDPGKEFSYAIAILRNGELLLFHDDVTVVNVFVLYVNLSKENGDSFGIIAYYLCLIAGI